MDFDLDLDLDFDLDLDLDFDLDIEIRFWAEDSDSGLSDRFAHLGIEGIQTEIHLFHILVGNNSLSDVFKCIRHVV